MLIIYAIIAFLLMMVIIQYSITIYYNRQLSPLYEYLNSIGITNFSEKELNSKMKYHNSDKVITSELMKTKYGTSIYNTITHYSKSGIYHNPYLKSLVEFIKTHEDIIIFAMKYDLLSHNERINFFAASRSNTTSHETMCNNYNYVLNNALRTKVDIIPKDEINIIVKIVEDHKIGNAQTDIIDSKIRSIKRSHDTEENNIHRDIAKKYL